MICPKCGSTNVNTQQVAITKNKHHGLFWWLIIGWWWVPLWWICFTVPALIIKIFAPKRIKTKVQTHCVCQQCGYSWRIK